MDQHQQNHNFELPTPHSGPPAGSDRGLSDGSSGAPATPQASPQDPLHSTQAPSPASRPVSSSPATADDADLIEKEWVTKAKQIVSATKDDPHKQNKEMSRFKAEYLKKRYHKDIKVEDV